MGHAANIPRPNRIAALLCVLAAHAAVLLVFFSSRSASLPPPPVPGAMTVMSLPDEPASKPPPPPRIPSKLEDGPRPIQSQISTEPESDTNASSSSDCGTLDSVTKALFADPAAVAAVLQAPPETRSIADAIIIWNGGWSDATIALDAPLAPVRTAVLQSLAAADGTCLDEQIAGPRLVPVPSATGTMFLVFGSGNWSWRQLTVDADQPAAQESDAEMPKDR